MRIYPEDILVPRIALRPGDGVGSAAWAMRRCHEVLVHEGEGWVPRVSAWIRQDSRHHFSMLVGHIARWKLWLHETVEPGYDAETAQVEQVLEALDVAFWWQDASDNVVFVDAVGRIRAATSVKVAVDGNQLMPDNGVILECIVRADDTPMGEGNTWWDAAQALAPRDSSVFQTSREAASYVDNVVEFVPVAAAAQLTFKYRCSKCGHFLCLCVTQSMLPTICPTQTMANAELYWGVCVSEYDLHTHFGTADDDDGEVVFGRVTNLVVSTAVANITHVQLDFEYDCPALPTAGTSSIIVGVLLPQYNFGCSYSGAMAIPNEEELAALVTAEQRAALADIAAACGVTTAARCYAHVSKAY